MTKRLCITGAGGFVAGSVIAQADESWRVHALSRGPLAARLPNLEVHPLDPLDFGALGRLLAGIRPDAIIHAGAIADIDYCLAHPDEARLVNTAWTAHLAGVAAEMGARFIYCSTDNVFDGERGRYTEDDPPNPVNLYGRTKVAGEQAVVEAGCESVIARISIVMGLPMLGAGNSFLVRMLPALERGEPVGVPDNEVRSPIDVVTLGRALLELAGNAFTGRIHLGGSDILDRCDLVRRIAAHLGYDPGLVEPRDPGGIPGRDVRPRDASLDNALARRTLRTLFPGVEDAVDLILAHRR